MRRHRHISMLVPEVVSPRQKALMREQRDRGNLLVNDPRHVPDDTPSYVPSQMPTNTTPLSSPAWDYKRKHT